MGDVCLDGENPDPMGFANTVKSPKSTCHTKDQTAAEVKLCR